MILIDKASERESEVLKKEVSFSAGLAARHTANICPLFGVPGTGLECAPCAAFHRERIAQSAVLHH